VTDSLGTKTRYPNLAPRKMTVHADYINRYIGVGLEAQQMAQLLTKMQLASVVGSDGVFQQVLIDLELVMLPVLSGSQQYLQSRPVVG
jgi:phenylalanyl-tRNA synthetase beta subunit